MKDLLKAVLRSTWRWTAPVRRPFARKIHAHLTRCVEAAHRPQPIVVVPDEAIVLMDQVVRELVRLQRQVDTLQQTVDALADEQDHPMISRELDRRKEHLKAG